MNVYFIVVCYNNEQLLDTCLESIYKQTYKKCKIIVVDNASTDNSIKKLKTAHKTVKLIESSENQGFAIANNIGIKQALDDPDCGYIAFLNTDATVDPNWTTTLVEFAQSTPNCASLQTPTLDYYDHTILDSRGITIDPQGRARQLGHREIYKKQENHVVFGVNAAACLYSAAFLKQQPFKDDYFDSDMWMYLEDVDLAARATMSGWSNWYIEGAFAYHMGSASSGKNPGFSVFLCYRNNYPLLLKNLPLMALIKASAGAVYTDLITLFSLLRGKNYVPFKAIVRGRFKSIPMLGLFLKKRKQLRQSSKISSSELHKLMIAK